MNQGQIPYSTEQENCSSTCNKTNNNDNIVKSNNDNILTNNNVANNNTIIHQAKPVQKKCLQNEDFGTINNTNITSSNNNSTNCKQNKNSSIQQRIKTLPKLNNGKNVIKSSSRSSSNNHNKFVNNNNNNNNDNNTIKRICTNSNRSTNNTHDIINNGNMNSIYNTNKTMTNIQHVDKKERPHIPINYNDYQTQESNRYLQRVQNDTNEYKHLNINSKNEKYVRDNSSGNNSNSNNSNNNDSNSNNINNSNSNNINNSNNSNSNNINNINNSNSNNINNINNSKNSSSNSKNGNRTNINISNGKNSSNVDSNDRKSINRTNHIGKSNHSSKMNHSDRLNNNSSNSYGNNYNYNNNRTNNGNINNTRGNNFGMNNYNRSNNHIRTNNNYNGMNNNYNNYNRKNNNRSNNNVSSNTPTQNSFTTACDFYPSHIFHPTHTFHQNTRQTRLPNQNRNVINMMRRLTNNILLPSLFTPFFDSTHNTSINLWPITGSFSINFDNNHSGHRSSSHLRNYESYIDQMDLDANNFLTLLLDLTESSNIPESYLSEEDIQRLIEIIGVVPKGASKEDIQKLPVSSYEKSVDPANKKEDESNTSKNSCSICLEDYKEGQEIITLPKCDHIFHKPCVTKWLDINKICPICRTEIC